MSGPIEQFDKLHAEADVLFLVYYRGHWCPFCQSYLKQLQSLTSSINAQNGMVVTVTAEPASELPATRSASGYQGETIVDSDNFLAKELKRRGLLDVAISDKKGYKHGMAQPAVLVLGRDGTVLFKWAIVPAFMNFGGAKDRPSLNDVWDNVQSQLKGQPLAHKKVSTMGALWVVKEKILG